MSLVRHKMFYKIAYYKLVRNPHHITTEFLLYS